MRRHPEFFYRITGRMEHYPGNGWVVQVRVDRRVKKGRWFMPLWERAMTYEHLGDRVDDADQAEMLYDIYMDSAKAFIPWDVHNIINPTVELVEQTPKQDVPGARRSGSS